MGATSKPKGMESDIGLVVIDALIVGEQNRGSAGCCVMSKREGVVHYLLLTEISESYKELVEESFQEHGSKFVVIDMDENKVLALDRETVISIQNSKTSLDMSSAPVWDMVLKTASTEVALPTVEWKRL